MNFIALVIVVDFDNLLFSFASDNNALALALKNGELLISDETGDVRKLENIVKA